MRALVLALGLLAGAGAGCGKADAPPPPAGGEHLEVVPAAEIQRGKDACADYVAKACACAKTVPAAQHACDLSHGEPEAIRLALEVSQSPDSARQDVIDAQKSIRKVAKACVEQLAQLPTLGCAP